MAKVIQFHKDRYLQLRVELLGLPSAVWRRVVVPGYHALLAALADPNGPDRFDLKKTNGALLKISL